MAKFELKWTEKRMISIETAKDWSIICIIVIFMFATAFVAAYCSGKF